jgi:hypothetical protein
MQHAMRTAKPAALHANIDVQHRDPNNKQLGWRRAIRARQSQQTRNWK